MQQDKNDANSGLYKIHPYANKDLCLAVEGDAHNGSPLKLANCTDGKGIAYSYNTQNGGLAAWNFDSYCIDVKDGTQRNGNGLQHWKCVDYSPNQIFDFVNVDPKDGKTGDEYVYEVQWTNTNYCLDVKDGNATAGSDVQIWRCVPSNTNQRWTVTMVEDAEADAECDGSLAAYHEAQEEAEKLQQKRGLVGHRRRTIF